MLWCRAVLDVVSDADSSPSPPRLPTPRSLQVQLDIRQGHQQTVDKVLRWLDAEGGVEETTVCDAGCGTGSLAIPLALRVRAGLGGRAAGGLARLSRSRG